MTYLVCTKAGWPVWSGPDYLEAEAVARLCACLSVLIVPVVKVPSVRVSC